VPQALDEEVTKMASITSPTRFVAKPASVSYGEAMSLLRSWLDSQRMQLTHFKLAPLGRVGFEVGFRDDADAIRFESGFDWLSPGVAWPHHESHRRSATGA
jgi:hypothetical protein